MERERIRWGILGTGSIAKLFAAGLAIGWCSAWGTAT
jgi:hypothetical protein